MDNRFYRSSSSMPSTPKTPLHTRTGLAFKSHEHEPPKFNHDDEPLNDVVVRLQQYFIEIIDIPLSYDQLKSTTYSSRVRPLINSLSDTCHHPAIVAALLCCKAVFSSEDDDRGINEARGYAAEYVAWRFLTQLQDEDDIIEYLCYELPAIPDDDERRPSQASRLLGTNGDRDRDEDAEDNNQKSYVGLNTLELAVVCDAKKFLSQNNVQRIVNGIWDGNIMFWESLNVDAKKKARIYNKRKTDPYCRLRVPRYQKVLEAVFLAAFLGLYYGVLVQRNMEHITGLEICLYIVFVSFAYDEVAQLFDAGTLFYSADIWSWADCIIIIIFVAFLVCRIVGLVEHDEELVKVSFDVLSLEALLLLPRIFSLFSLTPFFGTLVPALRQMTKEFIKFLALVVILYLGFLTTFTLLARDSFTLSQMSWMLIKIFFGSSYIGFDAMRQISPSLGAPLMLIFVTLTNILLITSLISLLSNSLTLVMNNAKEEYLFMFSTFVLESSTSRNRLTYFTPPLNLVALSVRPLRLCVPPDQLRRIRIVLLKITHFPFVAVIMLYERYWNKDVTSEDIRRQVFASTGPHALVVARPLSSVGAVGISRPDLDSRSTWKKALLGAKFIFNKRGASEDRTTMEPESPEADRLYTQVEEEAANIQPATLGDLTTQVNELRESLTKKIDQLARLIEAQQNNK